MLDPLCLRLFFSISTTGDGVDSVCEQEAKNKENKINKLFIYFVHSHALLNLDIPCRL